MPKTIYVNPDALDTITSMLNRHAEAIDKALDDAETDIRNVVEREWKGDASGKYLDAWTLLRPKADQIADLLQEFAQEAQKVKSLYLELDQNIAQSF